MNCKNKPGFEDYEYLLKEMEGWDFDFNKESKAGTVFTLITRYIWDNTSSGREILYEAPSYSDSIYLETLKHTKSYLDKYFEGEIIPLKDILKHKRGDVEIGIGGFADVLALIYPLQEKDGTLKAYLGENITMFIQFGKDDIIMESVVPYGSSNNLESKHYTDQMEMFTNQELKRVYLKESEILPTIVETYHP
jgi:acyl-homoserine-lactone acylase